MTAKLIVIASVAVVATTVGLLVYAAQQVKLLADALFGENGAAG